jgi:DNA-binding CsgD family transcriptional regulator
MISPAGTLASHVPLALWSMLDLVESAAATGRTEEVAAHVTAIHDARIAALSPRLALVSGAATAIASADAEAPQLFAAALATPGIERWPFDLARVRLLYGERLRRLHATTESRHHLAAAVDLFETLGAAPWADRARAELQAAGQRTTTSAPGPQALTPQEREIAELAATGLSNRDIGERLHLSPRTVAAHLYRAFPKLGIKSRAALRDALRRPPA